MRSPELKQPRAPSAPPLRQYDGLRLVVSRDSLQAHEVVWPWPLGRPTLGLNQDNLEKVAAFEASALMAMVFADSDQIHDSAGFGLRLAPEIHKVPPGAVSLSVGDKPLGHCARPLRRAVRFLAGVHIGGSLRYRLG